jgi:hypothetical protein
MHIRTACSETNWMAWAVLLSLSALISGCSGLTGGSSTKTPVPPGQTFGIFGTISPATGGAGATVYLSGVTTATSSADSSGAYTFSGLSDGTYAVTPSRVGYTFTPATQSLTVSGANVTGVDFTAQPQQTFSLSGTISPPASGSGTTLTLSGPATATVTANSSGDYTFGGLVNGTYSVSPVQAGYTFSPPSQTATVSGANVTGVNFTGTAGMVYFGTEPSHATYLPRSDSYCASAVTPDSWEPRPDNGQANHTIVSPPFGWDVENYWTRWRDKRAKVTGNFTGTTTEIIQWAACKWGIDEDTIRAAAVQESYWHMSTLGDVCGPVGEASYGLLQIKNMDCSGTIIHGGYPDTVNATALNVDWYAARIRSCYDGDFYDGGNWLYHGQTVDQIAAQNGWSYVFWACIGFHYSGDWSPGQPYELQVRQILANRTWEEPSF